MLGILYSPAEKTNSCGGIHIYENNLRVKRKIKLPFLTQTFSSFFGVRTFCQFSKSVGAKSWSRWCRSEHRWTAVDMSDIFSLVSTTACATSLTYFVRFRLWRSFTRESCWLSVRFFCTVKGAGRTIGRNEQSQYQNF